MILFDRTHQEQHQMIVSVGDTLKDGDRVHFTGYAFLRSSSMGLVVQNGERS